MEAPRLSAAFAAQMLGQMMPDPERRNSGALAAYEELPATALFATGVCNAQNKKSCEAIALRMAFLEPAV